MHTSCMSPTLFFTYTTVVANKICSLRFSCTSRMRWLLVHDCSYILLLGRSWWIGSKFFWSSFELSDQIVVWLKPWWLHTTMCDEHFHILSIFCCYNIQNMTFSDTMTTHWHRCRRIHMMVSCWMVRCSHFAHGKTSGARFRAGETVFDYGWAEDFDVIWIDFNARKGRWDDLNALVPNCFF